MARQGFTHVLNAAEGIDELQVNTNEYYYRDHKIKYMGIPGHDRPSWNISAYFDQTSKYIDNAIKGGGNKLFTYLLAIWSDKSAYCVSAKMKARERGNSRIQNWIVIKLQYTHTHTHSTPLEGLNNLLRKHVRF